MKNIIFFLIAVFSMANMAFSQEPVKKVAVYVTGEANPNYKKVIGSKMVSSITQSNEYTAIERTSDFLATLSKEQNYQRSGAVSDEQIAKLGQQFGVNYVVVADVSEVFESMFLSTRMIDVQTGQISRSAEANMQINSMDKLIKISDIVSFELLNDMSYSEYEFYLSDNNVRVWGPYDYSYELVFYATDPKTRPYGFHVASEAELELLIKSYKRAKKHIRFPVYTNIKETTQLSSGIELLKGEGWVEPFSYVALCHEEGGSTIYHSGMFDLKGSEGNGRYITSGYIYFIRNR